MENLDTEVYRPAWRDPGSGGPAGAAQEVQCRRSRRYTVGMGHDTDTGMDRALRIVHANEYRRVRWKNGRGWTREAVQGRHEAAADDAGGWDWRLSIAEIEEDAAYSPFPGVDREQMLLSGNGLHLHCSEGILRLLPPHDRAAFRGEDTVSAERIDGRVEVVNLMWRRDRVSLSSWFRPLVGPMLVFADPAETWLVHMVSGNARLDREPAVLLEAGDTGVLRGMGRRRRCMIEGAGSVLLARIAPVSPDASGCAPESEG